MEQVESISTSLAIRDSSKGQSPGKSLMGFTYIRPVESQNETGTSRFLVKEKATGKECILSMTTKREKSSDMIKELFQGHRIMQGRFLQPCIENDAECSEYQRFPRGIDMHEERVVRWYKTRSDCPTTPPATQQEQSDRSISHLLSSQKAAGRVDPNRQHIPGDRWAMVVDWIAEVAECFELDDAVIFQAMEYFDRFVSTSELRIKRHYYQLIAGACLWIASKSRKAITCKDICMSSDNSFAANDLVTIEEYVLKQLGWKLAFPTSLGFLEAYGCTLGLDKGCRTFHLMRYFSELALQSEIYLSYEPSMIAASALVLARFCAQDTELWSQELQDQTNYSLEDLSECTMEMSRSLEDVRSRFSNLIVVGRRYQKECKGNVSKISIPSIQSFVTLAAYQERHARSSLRRNSA
eukprot:scaffold22586_cov138-Cylindrotheca_fusiformis.AAC.29